MQKWSSECNNNAIGSLYIPDKLILIDFTQIFLIIGWCEWLHPDSTICNKMKPLEMGQYRFMHQVLGRPISYWSANGCLKHCNLFDKCKILTLKYFFNASIHHIYGVFCLALLWDNLKRKYVCRTSHNHRFVFLFYTRHKVIFNLCKLINFIVCWYPIDCFSKVRLQLSVEAYFCLLDLIVAFIFPITNTKTSYHQHPIFVHLCL